MSEKDRLKGKRILIVDDEPDVLETLEELLSECDIEKAVTFEQAVDKLEHQQFDMAILDIMGVNGYKLLEIANSKNVISIMLTAHAMTVEDTVKSYKKGAAYFVPKDEMANLGVFLNDILEAKEKGKSSWWRWLDRLGSYYDREFGPDWQENNQDFWTRIDYLP